MFYYLTSGIILGLSSGLSPGPLFMLVISQTLKFGVKEGIKVAITPLLTDLPIILLTLYFFKTISGMNIVLGIIALFGGVFIALMGFNNFREKEFTSENTSSARSIGKGMTANFLNPAPYIFWITVGAPTVSKGYADNPAFSFFFLGAFYFFMVGSKISLALMVNHTRGRLDPSVFTWVNRVIGVLLIALSVKFFYDAYHYLFNF